MSIKINTFYLPKSQQTIAVNFNGLWIFSRTRFTGFTNSAIPRAQSKCVGHTMKMTNKKYFQLNMLFFRIKLQKGLYFHDWQIAFYSPPFINGQKLWTIKKIYWLINAKQIWNCWKITTNLIWFLLIYVI